MAENQHGSTELPPASPLSKNSDGVESSAWQSSPLQRLENSAIPHMSPPVGVVVVRAGQPSSEGQTTRRVAGPSPLASSFSAPFRLQPRRPLVQPSVGHVRGSAVPRGRKRSAHSMSFGSGSAFSPSKGLPSFLSPPSTLVSGNVASTSFHQTVDETDVKGVSPSHVSTATSKGQESPAPRSSALVNFQCLSLQSPKPSRPHPSPEEDTCTPVQFQSRLQDRAVPQPPKYPLSTPPRDHVSLQRSSFTAYAPSSNTSNQSSRSMTSPSASSSKSEAKIAKCTVLSGNGTSGIVARPPLHHGRTSAMMLSLESTSRGAEDIGDERVIPPAVAVCQKNSPDSMSTLHCDDNERILNKEFQSPRPRSMFGPVATPKRRRAPTFNNSPRTPQEDFVSPSTYRSRQGRVGDFMSPSQRSIRSSPRTPLPRVTLTPRSAGSRSSRGLPRFPSPYDMDVSSPFLDMGTSFGQYPSGGSHAGVSRASTKSKHKAGDRKKDGKEVFDKDAFKSPSQASTGSSTMTGYYMGIKTQSLLTPSRSSSILQAIMMEDNAGSLARDNASVSDIDEDDAFVLASPRAIEEERSDASFQPAAKHQKRSSAMPSKSESCSSLKGICLVGSGTNLFGLVDQASDQGGESRKPKPSLKGRCKSDNSINSLGLTLDEGGNGEGGRDLVTPPSMETSKLPECPPLMLNEAFGVQHNATQANTVCVSGADPESVTVTIAKMAYEASHLE